MNNPFESGQIKNYVLLYTSVVVIVVLFFLATSIFDEEKVQEKLEFPKVSENVVIKKAEVEEEKIQEPRFKLLEKGS